jgi:hypothetical protein
MQKETDILVVPIAVKMVNPVCVKEARPPLYPMDGVAFVQQKLS